MRDAGEAAFERESSALPLYEAERLPVLRPRPGRRRAGPRRGPEPDADADPDAGPTPTPTPTPTADPDADPTHADPDPDVCLHGRDGRPGLRNDDLADTKERKRDAVSDLKAAKRADKPKGKVKKLAAKAERLKRVGQCGEEGPQRREERRSHELPTSDSRQVPSVR